MTNEEKALEAARVIKEEIGMSEHSIPRVAEIIDWCLTWKDQQFKECLENKKAELRERIKFSSSQEGCGSFPYVMYMTMVDQIINELFGEE